MKKITVEVLYPEIGNLYGDLQNISFLKRCYDGVEIIDTNLNDEPYFVENEPDLIYMGTMSESNQIIAIDKLRPYIDRINELIEKGVHFLITGNAFEIFGKEINDVNGDHVDCLGMFNFNSKRDMDHRYNSLYLGEFEGLEHLIVGFKSQFTHSYKEDESLDYAFLTMRGPGLNPDIKEEGIRKNNFFGTYIIGPILILNPYFTKWLLRELGADSDDLIFEKEAIDAYNERVEEYKDTGRGFYY